MSEPKSIDEIDAIIESKLQAATDERYRDGVNAAVRLLLPQLSLRDAKLEPYEKVFRLIAMRWKMQGFVDKNYPLWMNKWNLMIYGKPEELSYCDAIWKMIVSTKSRFTSDTYIMIIRQRLLDKSITPDDFIKFCRWLYNEFSDCDDLVKFAPNLPAHDDVEGIQRMFTGFEIDQDIAVKCVQIILEPFA